MTCLVRALTNMTHCYLIETISNCLHPQVLLCSRFCTFNIALQNSDKPSIRLLSALYKTDLRTTYGKNLRKISQMCDMEIDELTSQNIKQNMKYFEVPQEEHWRPSFIRELLDVKDNKMLVEGFTADEINDLIDMVCIS